jgi:hypothetical protein
VISICTKIVPEPRHIGQLSTGNTNKTKIELTLAMQLLTLFSSTLSAFLAEKYKHQLSQVPLPLFSDRLKKNISFLTLTLFSKTLKRDETGRKELAKTRKKKKIMS